MKQNLKTGEVYDDTFEQFVLEVVKWVIIVIAVVVAWESIFGG